MSIVESYLIKFWIIQEIIEPKSSKSHEKTRMNDQ